MCGIAGTSRLTDITRRMIPHLIWEIEDRGKDSWGTTNGVDVIKHLGPITKSWQPEVSTWSAWDRAIFHTRAASTGAVTIPNQHPFHVEKEGTTWLGIHNGVVTNHDLLNLRHKRGFECDSPHIFMAIAGFSDTEEIMGWGNLAWYTRSPEYPVPLLHLLKFNSDNLLVASLESGEIVFCSTREPIERAAVMAGTKVKTFYSVDSETEYTVHPTEDHPDVDGLYKVGPKKFGGRIYPMQQAHQSQFEHWNHNSTDGRARRVGLPVPQTVDQLGMADRLANLCLSSNCTRKVEGNRRKALVCAVCLDRIMKEMVRVETERALQESVVGV